MSDLFGTDIASYTNLPKEQQTMFLMFAYINLFNKYTLEELMSNEELLPNEKIWLLTIYYGIKTPKVEESFGKVKSMLDNFFQ